MSIFSLQDKKNHIGSTGHKVGYGSANGTFGELLQGILPDQRSFMVTFPVSLFSYLSFIPNSSTLHLSVYPRTKKKSAIMAKLILEYFQIHIGGMLTINSEIPEGKGLASSSADLVATAYALQDSLNLPLDPNLIAKFIAKIEPTDGVMYPGATSFYYKEGELKEFIANLPEIFIIAVDEGRSVDTLHYNNIKKNYTPLCTQKYEHLLSILTQAIKERDLETIGQIATESALMNQKHNYKNFLEVMINICKEVNGLGVAVAHSGTFVGILLDPNSKNFIYQKDFCCSIIKKHGKNVQTFTTLAFKENLPVNTDFEIKQKDYIC